VFLTPHLMEAFEAGENETHMTDLKRGIDGAWAGNVVLKPEQMNCFPNIQW
jgi:hypothetical protein